MPDVFGVGEYFGMPGLAVDECEEQDGGAADSVADGMCEKVD